MTYFFTLGVGMVTTAVLPVSHGNLSTHCKPEEVSKTLKKN